MATNHQPRAVVWMGLTTSLVVAGLLSPWASSQPDGLDRVARDLKFEHKSTPVQNGGGSIESLPSAQVFDEYAIKGFPEAIAKPMGGILGTLLTFSLAWGVGKSLRPSAQKLTPDQGPLQK